MIPQYEPVSLDRQAEYLERLAATPEVGSDYSFANVFGWAEQYGLEWSFGPSCVWIRQTKPYEVHWAPVGDWMSVDWSKCPYIRQDWTFIRVPETLAKLWEGTCREHCREFSSTEARDHFDYLYRVQDLVELSGKEYHGKKNHLNQFKKKYDYIYKPMSADCVEEVLQMQKEWIGWRELPESHALMMENDAILRILTSYDRIPGLFGATLSVDQNVVGYTIAEPLTKDTLVIHVEKGRPEYRGVYQAVNQIFLEHEAMTFDLVNREQDLGEEGLRKAKMSYHPVDFVKKYEVSFTM